MTTHTCSVSSFPAPLPQPHAPLIAVLFDELDADAKLTMVGLHPGRGAFPEGNDRLDHQPTQP